MWRSLTFHQSWSELSNTLTLHPALPKTRLHSDSDNTSHRKLTNLTASHRYRAVYRFVIGKDSEKSFDVASVLLLKKKACFYDQMWLLIVKFCTNSHKSKRVHLEFDMGGNSINHYDKSDLCDLESYLRSRSSFSFPLKLYNTTYNWVFCFFWLFWK